MYLQKVFKCNNYIGPSVQKWYAKVTNKLTQGLLSHVHNNANIRFQLKLDQALVQGSDKNMRYLFEVFNKNTKKENNNMQIKKQLCKVKYHNARIILWTGNL